VTTDRAETLLDRYDAFLLDLDGTVYRGDTAIDGAEHAVHAAHQAGVAVRFVTNNASRTPDDVADHLNRLGIPAKPDEVSTSAQAAAGLLVDRLSPGAEVLILGTDALAAEVAHRGFTPVRAAADTVVAVLQGLSQDMGWRDLAEACVAIRAGALWVACNVDVTLPTERGLLPGSGALVAALVAATDSHPLVAGKPARPLMDDAIRATAATHPLAIGDRLDTDIAGATNAGIDALLVLTGVSTAADLLAAPPEQRPRYVAADMHAVRNPAADQEITAHPDWPVETTDGQLHLRYTGSDDHPDPLQALRSLCAAWWTDEHSGKVTVTPEGDPATHAINTLGLTDH
jgi:glycerol-1-phosphatase